MKSKTQWKIINVAIVIFIVSTARIFLTKSLILRHFTTSIPSEKAFVGEQPMNDQLQRHDQNDSLITIGVAENPAVHIIETRSHSSISPSSCSYYCNRFTDWVFKLFVDT